MSKVELHDGFLRISEPDRTFDFHLRWLRHNCDVDRHAATGERLIESADLPAVLGVDEIAIDDAVLRVRWTHDRRVSRFPLAWLREHAYAVDRELLPRPPSLVSNLEVDGETGPAVLAERVLARLAARGAAVIRRNIPATEAELEAWIEELEERGLRATACHVGRTEDLRIDPADLLGNEDAAIGLHTDQPFLEEAPRYTLLQCIRAADTGGEILLADAAAAFDYLASLDREAADLLSTISIRFHGHQRDVAVVAPLVGRRDGRFQIRSSYFATSPYRVPFAKMESWYRAHDRFVEILRDPRHHYGLRLGPDEVLLYDNHRMVHGRTAFRGPRWFRSIFFRLAYELGDDGQG